MVEQCGGTVWWNSEKVMVQQWNSDGGTVWWNSGTVIVEQSWWTSVVEQCNSKGGTVEQWL